MNATDSLVCRFMPCLNNIWKMLFFWSSLCTTMELRHTEMSSQRAELFGNATTARVHHSCSKWFFCRCKNRRTISTMFPSKASWLPLHVVLGLDSFIVESIAYSIVFLVHICVDFITKAAFLQLASTSLTWKLHWF